VNLSILTRTLIDGSIVQGFSEQNLIVIKLAKKLSAFKGREGSLS
jgi:hypothetical protein